MKKDLFVPQQSGGQVNDLTAELLTMLDYLALSVVKLDLETGKAWLLHSVGREEPLAYEFDWAEFLNFYETLIVEDDWEKLRMVMSVPQLKIMWESDHQYYRLDLNCRGDHDRDWLEMMVRFCSKDAGPMVYVITRYSRDNHLLRRVIDLYVYNKCDCFIYLDAQKNSYTMFNGKKNTPLPAVSGAYDEEIARFAEEYVVPEDRDMSLREMEINHVMEMLEKQEVHSFTCGFWEQGVGYTRKHFEFRYYNRSKKMILLTRSDVTKVYEEQQRYTKDLQDAIRRAQTDPLTQLLNYQGIKDAVSDSLGHFNHSSAILFMDLDDFKEINDTYGHAAGDKALQQVAQVIQSSIRANDYASRIGGDEFVVFLNDIPNAECVRKCAERICKKLSTSKFVYGDIQLSCSIGVAIAPDEGTEYTELVKKADEKVYQAKARGKNQVAM